MHKRPSIVTLFEETRCTIILPSRYRLVRVKLVGVRVRLVRVRLIGVRVRLVGDMVRLVGIRVRLVGVGVRLVGVSLRLGHGSSMVLVILLSNSNKMCSGQPNGGSTWSQVASTCGCTERGKE